ncbi:MAG: hypothetical protein ACLU7D_11215 [Collinsella sp.]
MEIFNATNLLYIWGGFVKTIIDLGAVDLSPLILALGAGVLKPLMAPPVPRLW